MVYEADRIFQRIAGKLKIMLVWVLQGLIRLYSLFISPILGPNCRFHPTCSCYAQQALARYGALKGLWLTLTRILRCHPWGGKNWIDPVPDAFAWGDILRYKRAGQKKKKV